MELGPAGIAVKGEDLAEFLAWLNREYPDAIYR